MTRTLTEALFNQIIALFNQIIASVRLCLSPKHPYLDPTVNTNTYTTTVVGKCRLIMQFSGAATPFLA